MVCQIVLRNSNFSGVICRFNACNQYPIKGKKLNKSHLPSSSSLHEEIREVIRERVLNGYYEIGVPITSTTKLGEEFKVSQITVKRALRDLKTAGVLSSIPGKGTFVKERRRFLRTLDVWVSSMENAKELGFEPTIDLISITREKIIHPDLAELNPPNKSMYCVKKIILADGIPIMYDTAYVSTNIDEAILDECGERFIADALRRHNIEIISTNMVIDASPASIGAQQIFSITNGYPTLRRLYNISTSDSDISIYGIVESPFDRVACSITIKK